MLTPEEYNIYANKIIKRIETLEAHILYDLAKSLHKSFSPYDDAELPTSAVFKQETKSNTNKIIKKVKLNILETQETILAEIERLFESANIESYEREKKAFSSLGKELVLNKEKIKIIENSIKYLKKDIVSLTGSIGMQGLSLEKAYHKALNQAYLDVVCNGKSYQETIKKQVKNLSSLGFESIDYVSGKRTYTDVAIRRAVITGLKQTTNKISELNAKEIGCDGYEVSAHTGARPRHASWQGQQYAIEKGTKFPLFRDVVGNDMDEPNCRHSRWGIFLGITKPMMGKSELENLDNKPFKFSIDNKIYTHYQATQKQRSIERSIRKTKRTINGLKGLDDSEEIAVYKVKLKAQTQLYKEFSHQANLILQTERLGVLHKNKK